MANTFKFGNGKWATGDGSVLAYNDENDNFKPLPFTFTGDTDSTYVDSDGLIKDVKQGHARIDYTDNADGHLLLEPARTNLITQSNDFTDVSWTKLGAGTGSAAVITADYAISPDGTQNASRLQCDLNGGGNSLSNQSLIYDSYTSSGNQTISIYVKSNSGQNQTIYFANTQTSGDTITVTPQWQRFTFSHSTSTYVAAIGLRGRSGGAIDDTADILIYAAQAEAGSYATSLIKTAGSSVTRSNEIIDDITNLQSNSLLGTDEGTLFIDMKDMFFEITGTGVGSMVLYLDSTNQIEFVPKTNTTYKITLNNSTALDDISGENKIAISYDSTGLVIYKNGVSEYSTSVATYSVAYTDLHLSQSTRPHKININNIQLYDTRLTNAELITLTT